MNRWFLAALLGLFALAAACGGGDDSTSTPTPDASGVVPSSALTPLQQSLASVLLQPSDLPDGLEGGSPSFTDNNQLSNGDQTALATLAALGRQLGADIQYIPTDRLDPSSPIRGGVESSASAYLTGSGASQSYQDTAVQARANDWKANYPDIKDLVVSEVPQKIGDESLWIRLTGTAECTLVDTPTAGPGGVVPSATCNETKTLIIDNVLFRAGRVRGYIQVTTLFPPQSPSDAFVGQVAQWANLMVTRGQAAFPG